MQHLTEAHSYKVYDNAAKQIKDAFAELGNDKFHWFIIAQPDGRFTPVVRLMHEDDAQYQHYFIGRKIAVIN